MLSNEDRVRQQNNNLEGAKRVAYETQNVAQGIEMNLNDQNERAMGTHSNVRAMQGLLGESDNVISRMLKREKLNKLILAAVFGLLALGIIMIIYFKFFT